MVPVIGLMAWRSSITRIEVPRAIVQANEAGFDVIRHKRGSENGYYDFTNKQIAVRPDVSAAQAVKTLIHELGHALLHSDELPRSKETAEVEVESVAYIVCDAIGLDTGEDSFAYLEGWAEGSTELLKESGERVIGCARWISEQVGSDP